MKTPLSIMSWGAVSAGGVGTNALRAPHLWPTLPVPEVGAPDRTHPVAKVAINSQTFDKWRQKARLRRASPISLFMMEAATQALDQFPELDRSRVGMICVSVLGCTLFSSKFYRQFQTEGRRFASPALFPETVTNSPLSHLASELRIGGPVYTQIGDKSAWSSAVRTAACWMYNNDAEAVLVIGAEEFDPHQLDAIRAIHWANQHHHRPFAEGAGALLLKRGIHPGKTLVRNVLDGFCFNTKNEAKKAAQQCLNHFNPEISILDSATGWPETIADKTIPKTRLNAHIQNISHESLALSGAWDTIRAAQYLETHSNQSLVLPLWGLSHQIGALLLCGPNYM